nr:unnamed protein product [Callosobruchus analis]
MMEADEWKSEWAVELDQSNKCFSLISFEDGELVEYSNDGNEVLNATQDSIENTAAQTDGKIEFVLKPSLKGITQAKKRLKAFSASKLLKNIQVKEKNLNSNKSEGNTTKKLKKELYPDERARAVIQEIEEIKKAQARQQFQHAIVESMTKLHSLPVSSKLKSRSRSVSSDDERVTGHFKKREIKVRNIRRGKTGSVSPETHRRKSEKLSYPRNWSEYFQQNLDVKKDQELKSKLIPSYKRQNAFEMYRKMYNPQAPSMRIEPFVYSTNSGSKEVSPFFVRFTKAYPSVQYSINSTTNNESFITRQQLYSIISKEAKEIIEKLINSNHRSPPAKMLKERQWFNKSWKKIGTGESKFVENSVGLSFLQNYSDDDNDGNDEEEIIICSRVITSEKSTEQVIFEDMEKTTKSERSEKMVDIGEMQDTVHVEENAGITLDMSEHIPNEILPETTEQMFSETSKKIPEKSPQKFKEGTPEVLPEEITDSQILVENEIGQTPDVRSSDGFRTPELCPKSASEDRELDETRRAIEQLEDELKRKQETMKDDMRHVIELDLKHVRKQKNKDGGLNIKSKKKKKKVKAKKRLSSEDDSSSVDEKKKSKKMSKGKKLKKKSESEKPKKRAKKKKKRSVSTSDSSIDEEDEDENLKKKTSKKKKRKDTSKKNKKKLKKSKKTDWDETDEETVDEYSDDDKTESRKLRKLEEEHISKKKGDKHASKSIFEIVSSKDESDNKEFGIELKINKKYLMRKGDKRDVGEDDDLDPEESVTSNKSAKLFEDDFKSNKEQPEKSPYPLWESDEEVSPTKSLQKLNSSWESDEEVFVRRHYEPELESQHCVHKSFNNDSCGKLEIPLNIKPYRRRETFEPEIDLRILMEKKRKGEINILSQSDENQIKKNEDTVLADTTFDDEIGGQRKPLDNKQSAHFEDHIDLENQTVSERSKRIEGKGGLAEFKIHFEAEVAITDKKPMEVENLKKSELECKISYDTGKMEVHPKEVQHVEDSQFKPATPKRGRWDKRESTIKVSTPKSETDSVSTQSIHSEKNNSSGIIDLTANNASLENEYEEFLKAVTSNVAEDPEKSMPISISSMSDISDTEPLPVTFKKNDFIQKDIPPVQIPIILPKDVPFIPMPTDVSVIKPVPVPSPKIEVKKPLVTIDLDLIPAIQKPNVIIPPLSSVDLEVQSMSSNTIMQTPPSAIDDTSVSNSVDTSITNSVDINISNTTNLVVPNSADMNVDLDSIVLPPACESTSVVEEEEQKHQTAEETLDEQIIEEEFPTKPPEKQFSFSGMVLTTKKLLLGKPKLHFGDSDDEEPKTSLTKLEDIKKRNGTPKKEKAAEESFTTGEKIGSDEKKAAEEKKEVEQPLKESVKEETKVERKRSRSRSPHPSSATGKNKEIDKKREGSPHKRRRSPSPRGRRRSSPSRRKESPRKGSSPRRRSPGRRRTPEKKKHSSRRTPSPRRSSGVSNRKKSRRSTTPRKRGSSPKKRSPSPKKRSPSPRRRQSSPKRKRSPSPRRRGSPRRGSSPKSSSKKLRSKSPERIQTISEVRPRSPPRATSPHEGLKRSIADSTISDDLLPQPNLPYEEYGNSPTFFDRRGADSPRRIPLEERISQVLGETKEEPKAITSTYGNYARYHQGDYANQMDFPTTNYKPSSFVQVGNMLQIVPTELPTERPSANVEVVCQNKPSIIQVGNVLQIVPTTIPPQMPPLPPSPAPPSKEQLLAVSETVASSLPVVVKQSAEESMQQKVAERRAEREKRKLERDKKREEKERKRSEKEKKRQIRLKLKTENMIKRALQLEVEGGEEEDTANNEALVRWPPISVICSTSKDIGKSILTKSVGKREGKGSSQKIVSFADGIRPGEGTSPSGGEELTSPPPRKLPKEKRYTKTNMVDKIKKKKVKVKIIKKPPPPALSDGPDSDEDDLLPPPSPPPGSPPSHIFPPRVKVPAPNNLIPYAAAPQLQMYGAQLGLMMAPPPPPPPPPPLPSTPPHRQSPVGHPGRSLGLQQ